MEAQSGITLHLNRLEDLFSPPSFGEFGESADLESGIEHLVDELKAVHGAPAQVTVVIPESAGDPGVPDRLVLAIHRYAALRMRELKDQLTAQRHDGFTSLLWSLPAVAALTVLSVWVTGSSIDPEWRTAIDGLLIVLLWVALWYPLDALFWYGRPLSQELRALRRLEAGRITVRTDSSPTRPADSA